MNAVKSAVLFLTLLYVCGCRTEEHIVCLSVNFDNSQRSGGVDFLDTSTGDVVDVYFNGNIFRSTSSVFVFAPVDKYLMPGSNVIEIQGTARVPVDIRLASYEADHRTFAKLMMDEKVIPLRHVVKWRKTFQVKKPALLPIFDKKNQLPNQVRAEQEIRAVVTNMYRACASSNWDEFCRISLEGYRIHSPAEYKDVMSGTKAMIKTFHANAFPEKLHFIHGRNLVCVYACGNDNSKVLFESSDPDSCNVGAVDFAYIDGRWIVW